MTLERISDIKSAAESTADILLFAAKPISPGCESALSEAFQNAYADLIVLSAAEEGECVWYDPATLDVSFASFDGFAVKRVVFAQAGGLDLSLGEAAAADLVLRLKAAGRTARYLPTVDWLALRSLPAADRTASCVENLLLRAKHGSRRQFFEGIVLALKAVKHPGIYKTKRAALIGLLVKNTPRILALRAKRQPARGNAEFYGHYLGFLRGAPPSFKPTSAPLVSVVVRTYRREAALLKTLRSLAHQTYTNFEVVVVEDSEPTVETRIKAAFPDLKLRYFAMGKNSGRAKAAAKGIDAARGTYINLLDDDDFLFPEYLSVAVAFAETGDYDLVFSASVALETRVLSEEPYKTELKAKRLMRFPAIDPFSMSRRCLAASNAVLFKKQCYLAAGGIREELGAHEDWSLWLRLMAAGRYGKLDYAGACFAVPADPETERRRLESYAAYDSLLLEDERLVFALTAKELRRNYEDLLRGLMYLKQRGELDEHIDREYQSIPGAADETHGSQGAESG